MTMSKKEAAEMRIITQERDMARALKWPSYSKPQHMEPAKAFGPFITGWNFNWYHLKEAHHENVGNIILQHWSRGDSHGEGARPGDDKRRMGSRGSIFLYATRLDALKAMRLELTVAFALKAAAIDAEIEREENAVIPIDEIPIVTGAELDNLANLYGYDARRPGEPDQDYRERFSLYVKTHWGANPSGDRSEKR